MPITIDVKMTEGGRDEITQALRNIMPAKPETAEEYKRLAEVSLELMAWAVWLAEGVLSDCGISESDSDNLKGNAARLGMIRAVVDLQ